MISSTCAPHFFRAVLYLGANMLPPLSYPHMAQFYSHYKQGACARHNHRVISTSLTGGL